MPDTDERSEILHKAKMHGLSLLRLTAVLEERFHMVRKWGRNCRDERGTEEQVRQVRTRKAIEELGARPRKLLAAYSSFAAERILLLPADMQQRFNDCHSRLDAFVLAIEDGRVELIDEFDILWDNNLNDVTLDWIRDPERLRLSA